MVKQPARGKRNLRWMLPGLFTGLWFVGFAKVWQHMRGNVHDSHDFIPIYDEANKLAGFTHPTLVEAADKLRDSKDAADAAAAAKEQRD
jgi:hypothetical protein